MFLSRHAHGLAIAALASAASLGLTQATAQTIERVKLSDNDLSCQQIFAETQQMDAAMQLAGPGAGAAASTPSTGLQALTQNASPQSVQGGGWQQQILAAKLAAAAPADRAGLIAQINGVNPAAIHAAAVQQGLAQGLVSESSAGQAYAQAGGLAGLLGAGISAQGASAGNASGLAGMLGALAGMGARPAAATATAAAQPVAQAASAGGLGVQAKARKDHLTSLFLSRGCRMADIQK